MQSEFSSAEATVRRSRHWLRQFIQHDVETRERNSHAIRIANDSFALGAERRD